MPRNWKKAARPQRRVSQKNWVGCAIPPKPPRHPFESSCGNSTMPINAGGFGGMASFHPTLLLLQSPIANQKPSHHRTPRQATNPSHILKRWRITESDPAAARRQIHRLKNVLRPVYPRIPRTHARRPSRPIQFQPPQPRRTIAIHRHILARRRRQPARLRLPIRRGGRQLPDIHGLTLKKSAPAPASPHRTAATLAAPSPAPRPPLHRPAAWRPTSPHPAASRERNSRRPRRPSGACRRNPPKAAAPANNYGRSRPRRSTHRNSAPAAPGTRPASARYYPAKTELHPYRHAVHACPASCGVTNSKRGVSGDRARQHGIASARPGAPHRLQHEQHRHARHHHLVASSAR